MAPRPTPSAPPRLLRRFAEEVVDGTPAAQWRLLGWLWALGGLLALASLALGLGAQAGRGAVMAVGAASLLAGAVVLALATRLPVRLIGAVLTLGTTAVALAVLAAGDAGSPFVLFYAWVGAEAWYFLSARGALAYTAYATALAGLMALVGPDAAAGASTASWWLLTTGALVAVGTMAAALRVRSDRLVARLEAMAERDDLTGALNRRGHRLRLDAALAHARRHDVPLAVVACDLDHFKALNDAFGHQAGDEVLRAVVAACADVLRAGDELARVGGEELSVVLPSTGIAGAAQTAERLRAAVAAEVRDPSGRPQTASFGVAALEPSDGVRDLLERADGALYAAKAAGRDRIAVAPALHTAATTAATASGR